MFRKLITKKNYILQSKKLFLLKHSLMGPVNEFLLFIIDLKLELRSYLTPKTIKLILGMRRDIRKKEKLVIIKVAVCSVGVGAKAPPPLIEPN